MIRYLLAGISSFLLPPILPRQTLPLGKSFVAPRQINCQSQTQQQQLVCIFTSNLNHSQAKEINNQGMKIQVNRPSKAILFLSPKNKKADSKLLRTLSLSRINFFSGLCTRPCLRETFIITSRQSKITHSSHAAFFQKSEMCPPAKNGVTV